MQVGPEACEDVPPGMELCHYSDPRGKSLPAGSQCVTEDVVNVPQQEAQHKDS